MKKTTKKRNLKWTREKEYRALLRKEEALWERLGKKEVRELDTPYQNGYNLEFFIKEEYRYEEKFADLHILVDTMQYGVWCRDKSFKKKNWKGVIEELKPSFRSFSPYHFDKIDERIKKYYVLTSVFNSWSKKSEPLYKVADSVKKFLRFKKSKNIITHAYIVDGELESEDAFIDYQKDKLFYDNFRKYSFSYKYKEYNKRSRRMRDVMYEKACMKGDLYGKDYDKLHYNGKSYNVF